VVAEEIEARTPGGSPAGWVEFRGLVESVSASALEVRVSCETPTLVVAGRTVKTDGTTRFKWSDGEALSPGDIVAGDRATVGGWSKNGYVLADRGDRRASLTAFARARLPSSGGCFAPPRRRSASRACSRVYSRASPRGDARR
jgi:Domain of unknown function (DUF5666)